MSATSIPAVNPMQDSPMDKLLRKGLSVAGMTCTGNIEFYKWINEAPEGKVYVLTLDHLRKMLLDPEGEYFFLDMDKLHVEGLTSHPINLEYLGFQMGYSGGEWSVKPFYDIVDLPHDMYDSASGEAKEEEMLERIRLLTERIRSILDILTEVANSRQTT